MQLFLAKTPFFRLFLFLVSGILLYNLHLPQWFLLIPFVGAFLFLLLHLVTLKVKNNYSFRWFFGSGIFLFILGIGYAVSYYYIQKLAYQLPDAETVYMVELTDNPIEKEKTVIAKVNILKEIAENHTPNTLEGKALIFIAKDSNALQLNHGDKLVVSTQFAAPKNKGNPEEFDYVSYLHRQGINATAYAKKGDWKKIGENTAFSVRRKASESRAYLLNVYKRYGIHNDEYGVLAALTLGYKNALSEELREGYSVAGGMHVLAVSGLHVGILYVILAFLFAPLSRWKNGKVLASLLVLTFLWGYAFITGLSASVVRASIMFSLINLAKLSRHKAQIFNTIFLSAFVMLLFNPNYLYDVGFQLSYSAVLGIVYFQPKFSRLFFFKNKLLRWSWELVCVSVAAQLVTFPFGLYYFHQFSTYFLLTNFLVIPAASVIIYGAIILFILSPISFAGNIVGFLLNYVLKALNTSVLFIESLPFSALHTWINEWQLFLLFLVILLMAVYVAIPKFFTLQTALLSAILFLLIALVNDFRSYTKQELIVWNINKATCISMKKNGECFVYSTDSARSMTVMENYLLKNNVKAVHFLDNNSPLYQDGFLSYQGKSIYIAITDSVFSKITNFPLEIDYVLIGGKIKAYPSRLYQIFSPKTIVFDADVPEWLIKKYKVEKKTGQLYAIKQQGAFVVAH
jgi:competence protein ComEC